MDCPQGSHKGASSSPSPRRVLCVVLSVLFLLSSIGATELLAAPSTLSKRKGKSPARKGSVSRSVRSRAASRTQARPAPDASSQAPRTDVRSMRAAEGAIVNIIDSYLDRRVSRQGKRVFIGKFPVTSYWTADEIDEGLGPKHVSIAIQRRDGTRYRTRVSAQFKRRLDVEGTAMLEDGRVLNVTSTKGVYDDVTRVATLGLGTGGRSLVPFRSIAVNRFAAKGLRVGDRVFIPKAVGLKLPSGAHHDGFFRVDDVGSGVRGIDIYTLTRRDSDLIERVLKNDRQALPLYKIVASRGASDEGRENELAQLD